MADNHVVLTDSMGGRMKFGYAERGRCPDCTAQLPIAEMIPLGDGGEDARLRWCPCGAIWVEGLDIDGGAPVRLARYSEKHQRTQPIYQSG